MMKKLLIVCSVMMAVLTASAQPKVIIKVVTPDSTTTLLVPEETSVEFQRYHEQRVGVDIIDLGLSVKWASVDYFVEVNGNVINTFPWPSSDFVSSDWGERFGEPWRIPSQDDFQELMDNCTWDFKSDYYGQKGYLFTSNVNGESLFLPCNKTEESVDLGCYWTSDSKDEKGVYFSFYYIASMINERGFKNDKSIYSTLAIRPVYGQPQSKAKPLVQNASAQDYRSAIIEISVDNVEQVDIHECGVYYALDESYLPTNQKPNAPQAYKKAISLNANNTAQISLDGLTSGATYYVCAYVTTEKGTTFSKPVGFTVDGMTVSFANTNPKSVGQNTATVTLNLQGYPLPYISKYGVKVTGGNLWSEEFTGYGTPMSMVSDVEIYGLEPQTQYTCVPFAVFNNEVIQGTRSLTFTTTDSHSVNEKFPIPTRMVDLKLPSGLLWAPYNMGDKSETETESRFYGWGDPTGEATQTGNTAQYANGSSTPGPDGYEYDIAGTEYDIATVQWGDKWHLPSRTDFQELYSFCMVTEEIRNGIKGLMFRNKYGMTDDMLWLPLSGNMSWNGNISNIGTDGFYWTSETSPSKNSYRIRLQKAMNDENFESCPRSTRACIRPVYGEVNHLQNPEPPQPNEDYTLETAGFDDTFETAYPKEAVDMGLPSGTKWAAWNVGALKYGDMGKYYAWGEITTKNTFTSGTYNTPVRGYQVYDLPDSVNVVKQLWGKGSSCWTMPGEEDFAELFTKDPMNPDSLLYVSVRWETDEAHNYRYGIRVISRSNGNSIFFPAGGNKTTQVSGLDSQGWYWSSSGSSLNGKRSTHAVCLNFGTDSYEPNGMYYDLRNIDRFEGFMVRPVWKENSSARELTTP